MNITDKRFKSIVTVGVVALVVIAISLGWSMIVKPASDKASTDLAGPISVTKNAVSPELLSDLMANWHVYEGEYRPADGWKTITFDEPEGYPDTIRLEGDFIKRSGETEHLALKAYRSELEDTWVVTRW